MKIEIEVSNIELFSKALNNALVAYRDIVTCINVFGIDPQISSKEFTKLADLPAKELTGRLNELKQVYLQIENIERRGLNDQRRTNYEENA